MPISFGSAYTLTAKPTLAAKLCEVDAPNYRVDDLSEYDGNGFKMLITDEFEKTKLNHTKPQELDKIKAGLANHPTLNFGFLETMEDLLKKLPDFLKK